MKKILLFILFPILSFGQTEIGTINGKNDYDTMGQSISLTPDGSTIAIGSAFNADNGTGAGLIRVYQRISNVWKQVGNDIYGEKKEDYLGRHLTLSGDGKFLVCCGYTSSGANYVRMYRNVSGSWIKQTNNLDFSTLSRPDKVVISNDGNVLAFGFSEEDHAGFDSGTVKIFRNNSSNWQQIGEDIDGEASNSKFGKSISLTPDGSKIAIGGYQNSGSFLNAGYVRVFSNVDNKWIQIGSDIDGKVKNANCGFSVSLSADGNTVVVGAPGIDQSISYGSVSVYQNEGGIWKQKGNTFSGTQQNNHIGYDVALSSDGSIVAFSDNQNSDVIYNAGQTKVYKYSNGGWNQIGENINGTGYDLSGTKIAISADGSIVAINASISPGGGKSRGEVRIFQLFGELNVNKFILNNTKIYPNPASQFVTIDLQENLVLEKINIYDILGQLIKTENNKNINVNNLSRGTYFFEVITDKGKAIKKILVN
jgi:hypothetical protein